MGIEPVIGYKKGLFSFITIFDEVIRKKTHFAEYIYNNTLILVMKTISNKQKRFFEALLF
jgi:hypothetical protein